jgi:hypothetical protein
MAMWSLTNDGANLWHCKDSLIECRQNYSLDKLQSYQNKLLHQEAKNVTLLKNKILFFGQAHLHWPSL